MLQLYYITLWLLKFVTAIKYGEEECTSRQGWRGTCKPSWECLQLGDLVAQGYQPELCGTGEPIACCPNSPYTNLINNLMALSPAPYPFSHMLPNYGMNQFMTSIHSHFYPQTNGPSNVKYKRKRYPGPYLKTYIQDEDDNTIVRVTPIRAPLKRKKRKPLSTPFRALKKNMKDVSIPLDLFVQDDQLSLKYEKPQSPSVKKCQEYATFAWESSTDLSSTDDELPISQEFCPNNNRESQVLAAEFPFMVGLGYEDQREQIFWGCSGTLISKDFVLTAAHCLHPPLGRPKVVRLGTPHLDSRGQGLEVGISEVILHPLYNPADRTANIALIRLAPVPYLGIKLRPACLETNSTGLLLSPYWVTDPTVTMELQNQKNEFNIVADSEALQLQKTIAVETNKNYCNISSVDENYLCVETLTTHSCQSLTEGGEPLIQKDKYNPCLHTIIGVAIDKACSPFQPTLYTRIHSYVSWIENNVWP